MHPDDSAGTPWSGRELSASGFEEEDTGAADAALTATLARGAPDHEVMAALAVARLLVPILAEPGADMAAATLLAPDGERALPVFTSVDSLARWDDAARPVPVTAARAAQAAVTESCDVVVVDVAGPHPRVLRPTMVWALAQERDWLAPHDDPFVAGSVARAVAEEAAVTGHELAEGQPSGAGVLAVVMDLVPGLDPQEVHGLATRVGERLATDGELRARIDGLTFRIR